VLNEVRYGGVAERLEIREDTRGLGQREREKHARKLGLWEVVVVLIEYECLGVYTRPSDHLKIPSWSVTRTRVGKFVTRDGND
jgi:hypothetical protein